MKTEETYKYTHTDTFCGEANFSWLQVGEVKAKSLLSAVRKIKKEIGMENVPCRRFEHCDQLELRPRGMCAVLFIE
jgi:hypothetical protein